MDVRDGKIVVGMFLLGLIESNTGGAARLTGVRPATRLSARHATAGGSRCPRQQVGRVKK